MSSLNKVQLIGNLGADPEIRHTNDGRPIANFSIATSDQWKDKSTGEKRERTEWHRCVCFNEALSKIIERYVGKGDKIYVEGQLQTRKWEDQDGVTRYSTEVVLQGFDCKMVMLGNAGGGRRDSAEDRGMDAGRAAGRSSGMDLSLEPDDEIPF